MATDYSKFKTTYDGSSIGLEIGLKATAKQASMYLGSTGPDGLKYQIGEILDNSIDESAYIIKNRDSKDNGNIIIELDILEDSSVRIRDYGRGIPVSVNPKTNRPAIESVFESTSSGGKSYSVDNKGYGNITRGVHGAGAAVVAATSEFMDIKVTTVESDSTYTLKYGNQERTQEVTKIGSIKETNFAYGTEIHYKYDKNIFKSIAPGEFPFRYSEIENLIINYCYSCEHINFRVSFKEPGKPLIKKEYNSDTYDLRTVIDKNCEGHIMDKSLSLKDGEYVLRIICGPRHGNSIKYAIANGITLTKSVHSDLFPIVMNSSIELLLAKEKILRPEYPLQFKAETALNYALILEANNPEYDAQHKSVYTDPVFAKLLKKHLRPFILQNGGQFLNDLYVSERDKYIKMVARLDAKKKEKNNVKKVVAVTDREKKYMSELTSSLAPTSISDLIITEGDSSSVKLREILKQTQGLTYVEGLFPNAYSLDEDRFADSRGFKPLKQALSLDWKRIILLSDPDPIGGFIQCLLLVMIAKYYPHYLQTGRICILRAPLFTVYGSGNKIIKYLYTEEEKQEYIKKNPTATTIKAKGLASLSNSSLKYLLDYTYEDSDERLQVVDNADLLDGVNILKTLFGRNVAYRKHYVLSQYGTPRIIDYYNKKKQKKESQQIGFDIASDLPIMSRDLGYLGNVISDDEYSTTMETLAIEQGIELDY